MDNFFLSDLKFKDLSDDIFATTNITEMYFQKEGEAKEATIEELLNSFESESENTISIKIGIMKNLKNTELSKYEIFFSANNYINKYFYDMKILEV